MPKASEAIGIRRKLLDYSLNTTHARGGPKARGFEQTLGITANHADHLETKFELES